MWPDFEHLLSHSWSSFLAGQGTSASGFLAPYLVALTSGIIVTLAILHYHGMQAMIEHWKRNAVLVLCAALGGNLIVYVPLFGWNIVKTVYQDHVSLVGANAALQNENTDLHGKIQQQPPPEQPEAPNSLRRQVKGLANDIEAFLKQEQGKQRQFIETHGGGDAMRDYYIESQARFVSKGLQDRTVQIVHVLEAKGLPIGGLQYVSQNGYVGFGESELEHLRDLAYRLDKDGNVINF